MLEVAKRAGTPDAMMPPVVALPTTPNATVTSNATANVAAVMTKGHTFMVTELHGEPTAIAAVVVKRRSPKY